jgi:hypothetical protein
LEATNENLIDNASRQENKSVQTPQNAHQFLNTSTSLALTQTCPTEPPKRKQYEKVCTMEVEYKNINKSVGGENLSHYHEVSIFYSQHCQ